MPPVITRETEAPGTEAPGISGCALQIKGAVVTLGVCGF